MSFRLCVFVCVFLEIVQLIGTRLAMTVDTMMRNREKSTKTINENYKLWIVFILFSFGVHDLGKASSLIDGIDFFKIIVYLQFDSMLFFGTVAIQMCMATVEHKRRRDGRRKNDAARKNNR